jgi:hypothetical protein
MVIAILHFVFGGLGLLMTVCGGVGQMAGGNAMMAGGGGGQATKQQKVAEDFQKAMQADSPAAQAVSYGELGFDVMLSLLMIISGVGLLRMQPWGRILSILYAILSIAFKVFVIVYTMAFVIPTLNTFVSGYPDKDAQVTAMLQVMQVMMIILLVVVPVVTMIYPIIVLVIMLRPRIAAAFRGEAVGPPPEEDYRDPGPEDRYDRADG